MITRDSSSKELLTLVMHGEQVADVLEIAMYKIESTTNPAESTMLLEISALAAAQGTADEVNQYLQMRLSHRHESELELGESELLGYALLHVASAAISFNNDLILPYLCDTLKDIKFIEPYFSEQAQVLVQIYFHFQNPDYAEVPDIISNLKLKQQKTLLEEKLLSLYPQS